METALPAYREISYRRAVSKVGLKARRLSLDGHTTGQYVGRTDAEVDADTRCLPVVPFSLVYVSSQSLSAYRHCVGLWWHERTVVLIVV